MRARRRALLALLLLAGCTVMGPNYERAASTPVPKEWRDTASALRDSSYANVPWWDVFEDSTLKRLIRRALVENRDLRVAIARVNEARAQYGIQRMEALPQVDVDASSRKANGADSLLPGKSTRSLLFIEATLNWELDLWGRLRRLNESALASLRASEQDRRGVILTVVSDVARAYMELRDLDRQLAIAEAQLEIRRKSLAIARARFQGGLTSQLDVRQGENALADAEGVYYQTLRLRTQKENEISVLLGHTPEPIPRGLPLSEQKFPRVIPAGIPCQLLERRPDIQAAEERLRAANARVGAAVAALFPTISLTGATGTVSQEASGLFKPGSYFWHAAANLVQPVINKDRNRKQVEAERARTEEALGSYEQTVLVAFREVEDGLIAVKRLREELDAAERSSAAARLSVHLATLRYEGGVDTYLTLLIAQRAELDAELHESDVLRQQKVAVVQLYKALGGGWDTRTDSLAVPPPKPPR